MRRVRRAQHAASAGSGCGLVGIEQAIVRGPEAPGPPHGVLRTGSVELDRGAGQAQSAALGPADVQALGHGDPTHLVDGVVHRVLQGQGAVPRAAPGHRVDRGGEQRRAPAAVAPTGAESGDLGLEDRDPGSRRRSGQVVRGPQPRIARAHDDYIDVEIALEGGARRWNRPEVVPPQRQPPQVAHRSRSGGTRTPARTADSPVTSGLRAIRGAAPAADTPARRPRPWASRRRVGSARARPRPASPRRRRRRARRCVP